MTTQRPRANRFTSGSKQQPAAGKFPARQFPIQHEIQELENELNAFNERIVELENEGHRGHALEVLKAKAMDFARQIDELRSLLVEPTSQRAIYRERAR
jgi:chromosome segregation ATPase